MRPAQRGGRKTTFCRRFFRNKARVLQTRCTACLACVPATLQLVAVCKSGCHGRSSGEVDPARAVIALWPGCILAVDERAQARPTHS